MKVTKKQLAVLIEHYLKGGIDTDSDSAGFNAIAKGINKAAKEKQKKRMLKSMDDYYQDVGVGDVFGTHYDDYDSTKGVQSKELRKKAKRIWNNNADHSFFKNNVAKLHMIGYAHSDDLQKNPGVDPNYLKGGGKTELSTFSFMSNTPLKPTVDEMRAAKMGEGIYLVLDGRVTWCGNFDAWTEQLGAKKRSDAQRTLDTAKKSTSASGLPKRPGGFELHRKEKLDWDDIDPETLMGRVISSEIDYERSMKELPIILDKEDFESIKGTNQHFQHGFKSQETIIDNWKIDNVLFVIGEKYGTGGQNIPDYVNTLKNNNLTKTLSLLARIRYIDKKQNLNINVVDLSINRYLTDKEIQQIYTALSNLYKKKPTNPFDSEGNLKPEFQKSDDESEITNPFDNLEEGFFDFKDSPILKGLGVVDGEKSERSPALSGADDAWANLELALSAIPTKVAAQIAPSRPIGSEEDDVDGPDPVGLIRPKIARHLDFDNDSLVGDRDDIIMSFEKLSQIDIEFVESENVSSNQAAFDFCKSVKEAGASYLESYVDRPDLYDFDKLKQIFNTYLENQQEINSSFFADVLNVVAETVIKKNFKNIIVRAAKENPGSFTFTADDVFDPNKGVLSFPFQIVVLTGEQSFGDAYFKVSCELDFANIYQQLDGKQLMYGPLLDINFAWKIKVERTPGIVANVPVIPVRAHNLNRPKLFKFIIGLNKLANDIVSASDPFSPDDVKNLKGKGKNIEIFKHIIYYAKNAELGELRYSTVRSSTHTNKPIYLTDIEREIKIARDLLSAVKHLKSEQSTLFRYLRDYDKGHGYDSFKTAERMVATMKEIPDLDYLGQSDFVLSDYFEKLKKFTENYKYSDPRDWHNHYPEAEEAVKEFVNYVLNNNQKIVQGIRKQIKILEGELNESVSHLIFERVKQRFKV